MAVGVSEAEKASAAELRSLTPAELYRKGKRGQESPLDPAGTDLLIATTAAAIRDELSNAGLAVFGAQGLVQLADIVVREKVDFEELADLLEHEMISDDTIIRAVGGSITITTADLRAAAERLLSHGQTDNPAMHQPVLEQSLGDEHLFGPDYRHEDGGDGDTPVVTLTDEDLLSPSVNR